MFISGSTLSASLPPTGIFIFVVKMPIPARKKKDFERGRKVRSRVKVEKKIDSDQEAEERGKL